MSGTEPRLCAVCGLRLDYSGRGRPPVAHRGRCARLRKNVVEEERKERVYREALASAAVLSPGITPEHVETSLDDAGTMLRLAAAGYAPHHNDLSEPRPHHRARNQHRTAVLASLSSTPDANLSGPATDAPVRCLDCPVLARLDGVRGVFTSASLLNLRSIAEDARLRRHLAEDDVEALMGQRPA